LAQQGVKRPATTLFVLGAWMLLVGIVCLLVAGITWIAMTTPPEDWHHQRRRREMGEQ
jgi:hypothetical protein